MRARKLLRVRRRFVSSYLPSSPPTLTPHSHSLTTSSHLTSPHLHLAVSAVRRVGYFESNPTIDAAMTSPKARFGFRGAYLPTQFVPRAVLSEEDEKALVQTFEKLRYQTVMNPFVIATLMRPFDPVHCGSVTNTRFERVMSTHFERIDANDISLLSKAYADPRKENEVRYSALSADVTPDIVDDGMPRPSPAATKLVPGSPRPSVRKDHAPSPNVRLAESMALGASEDEMREGYRVLLRTLHERRIRIADVFRDFALHSPLAGRITRDQMIRGLSSIGLGSVTIDPRVVDAIAGMYTISSDPQWVDHVACIRDLEATTYLRHLETMDPFTLNETFSREVAMSPNPRFTVPVLPADDEKALQKVITALSARAARDRIFNVRIFAAQYDKQHNVRGLGWLLV